MRARAIGVGLLLAGLAGCGQGTPSREEQSRAASGPPEDAKVGASYESVPALDAAAPGSPEARRHADQPAELPLAAARTRDPASRMVVRTGHASLQVDSLEPGLAALRRLAARLGGYVANTTIQAGEEQLRTATLEVKVPSERFDELTSGLGPVGRLEHVNVTAEDVGEEFVDLTARAANARRMEERLVELLGTRTGRLQDVLAVERELARVREEIERMQGRLRYLESRSTMSTLAVTLHEPPPVVGPTPGRNVVAEAIRQAWRNFVGVLAAAIASLGYVVPVAGLAWVAVLFGRRIRRQTA